MRLQLDQLALTVRSPVCTSKEEKIEPLIPAEALERMPRSIVTDHLEKRDTVSHRESRIKLGRGTWRRKTHDEKEEKDSHQYVCVLAPMVPDEPRPGGARRRVQCRRTTSLLVEHRLGDQPSHHNEHNSHRKPEPRRQATHRDPTSSRATRGSSATSRGLNTFTT